MATPLDAVEHVLHCFNGLCLLHEAFTGPTSSISLVLESLIVLKIIACWLYPAVRKAVHARRASRKFVNLPRSLRRFAKLQRATKCPFARRAKLVGATLTTEGNLKDAAMALVEPLTDLTEKARKRRLDGFVIVVPAQPFATDLATFAASFNAILRTFAEHDPSGTDCFKTEVLSPDWQFSFNGMRFFITSFAPFYADTHARYSQDPDAAFIYLQPEFSFDHHGISGSNPNRQQIKSSIREGFERAGIPYDAALVTQQHEAFKYVKPLAIGDEPVRWWTTNSQ